MTTQTEQMEAFPKTTMEVLESLRAFHVADVEKAGTALDNLSDDEKVARRYEKAEERLAAARDLVCDIDRAIAELRGMEPTVEDTIRDMKRTAEESGTQVTLSTGGESVTFGAKTVDPVPVEEVAADIFAMADAGDFDAAGIVVSAIRGAVDPITGEVAPGIVWAFYPDDDEPHETQVGDRTRYGELVADYFTAAGLNVGYSTDDWTVVARRELTQDGGGHRDLRDIIGCDDYGQELLVVAIDQGSVTGAPAEASAA
jgi:hypothetical protein